MQEQSEHRHQRRDTVEGRVLAILHEAFSASDGTPLSIGIIADRFNKAHGAEYGQPVSQKWMGHIVRKNLRLPRIRRTVSISYPSRKSPRSKRFGAIHFSMQDAFRSS